MRFCPPACALAAFITVWRGQSKRKAAAVNLKGQAALFVIVGLPAKGRGSILHTLKASFSKPCYASPLL
jgi:hypothetical protein